MQGFYQLIFWKGYLEEKNTWEPSLAVIYFRKFISTFHKEYPEKPTAISSPLDSVPLMIKPLVSKKPKQKYGRPSKGANKRGRNQRIKTWQKYQNGAFCGPKIECCTQTFDPELSESLYLPLISIWFSFTVFLAKLLEVFYFLQ